MRNEAEVNYVDPLTPASELEEPESEYSTWCMTCKSPATPTQEWWDNHVCVPPQLQNPEQQSEDGTLQAVIMKNVKKVDSELGMWLAEEEKIEQKTKNLIAEPANAITMKMTEKAWIKKKMGKKVVEHKKVEMEDDTTLFQCDECGTDVIIYDGAVYCDICETIPFNVCCCSHYFCTECNAHFDPEQTGCENCEKCDACVTHNINDECNPSSSTVNSEEEGTGTSFVPPWEERGKEIVFPKFFGQDWESQWHIEAHQVDLVKLMADFYLLSACAQGCVNVPFLPSREQEKDGWLRFLKDAARADLDRLVEDHVHRLTAYVCMAVGGELRYHRAVKGADGSRGDRTAMWVKWKYILDQVGPQAMADAGKLFREMKGDSVGGKRWAAAAEMAHMYLTRRISAFVWMDRMFTMQHNGGSLFNKIPWATQNNARWGIDACKRYIGPAHAANPTEWPVLLIVASDEVRVKFNEQWAYGNRMKRQWNLPRVACPKEADGWHFRGAWGLVRLCKDTHGHQFEIMVDKHLKLGKKARLKGAVNEDCVWITWESPKTIHINKGKLPPGIELTYHEGNGHKAIKFPNGIIKSVSKSSSWGDLFDYLWLPVSMKKTHPEIHQFWNELSYKDKYELTHALLEAAQSGELEWPDKKQWKKEMQNA